MLKLKCTESREHQPPKLKDSPVPVDVETGRSVSETESFEPTKPTKLGLTKLMEWEIWTRPWIGWAFTYCFVLVMFFFYRQISMTALIRMYATAKEATISVYLGAVMLGLAEDFVCATYLVSALWLFDILKHHAGKRFGDRKDSGIVRFVRNFATFTVSWLLCITAMAPFSVDLLLVRARGMRFTFALVAMAINERDSLSAVPISPDEVKQIFLHGAVLVVVATLFASLRTWAPWMDLTSWNPSHIICCQSQSNGTKRLHDKLETSEDVANLSSRSVTSKKKRLQDGVVIQDSVVQIGEPVENMETEKMLDQDNAEVDDIPPTSQRTERKLRLKRGITVIVGLVVVPAIVVVASSVTSPLIAYSALNTSLNELFGGVLEPTLPDMDGTLPWPEKFIHPTEDYTLLGSNSLYRRTTGFNGELAFNVTVAPDDPPNVLLIVVESFRYHDSHYLVGEEDPSNLFKGTNLTITPNFDRWAKRGVALRNLWSSLKTSRSVESLLFGQLPYDSTTKTGTTGGWKQTKLSGLPQLFTAKGYETFFATGCKTNYDGWDDFLPAHGFDTVWGRNEMMIMASIKLGIKSWEWYGSEHRGLGWGVHDDVSFRLLGNLLINKTEEQNKRVADNKPKKPLFLTHYTISSHLDFTERPKWYAEAEKPDFSALYEGQEYADVIQHYLEMRYFTDMELGKFMDRMAEEGILNDTIVVIVGDHGQAPEMGTDVPENREVSVTRVAGTIIAEGRLVGGDALVIDDPTEQYDILNTLADITGVPDGGFIQDGVGRSLKRKVEFGERDAYSNNPCRKMSIVHGHQRFRYDGVTDSILLHDADKDHDMATDLFPELTAKEQAEWLSKRDDGRRVSGYYKKRWDNNCLFSPDCTRT